MGFLDTCANCTIVYFKTFASELYENCWRKGDFWFHVSPLWKRKWSLMSTVMKPSLHARNCALRIFRSFHSYGNLWSTHYRPQSTDEETEARKGVLEPAHLQSGSGRVLFLFFSQKSKGQICLFLSIFHSVAKLHSCYRTCFFMNSRLHISFFLCQKDKNWAEKYLSQPEEGRKTQREVHREHSPCRQVWGKPYNVGLDGLNTASCQLCKEHCETALQEARYHHSVTHTRVGCNVIKVD